MSEPVDDLPTGVVVEVHSDTDDFVAAAAARFTDVVRAAQAARGSAAVVLTGGGAGIKLLESLRSADVDFSRIDFYWGDDRFVPHDDAERNEKQAREALLDHVPVDPARVFPMSASDGEYPDPMEAAGMYDRLVAAVPAFDIHLLGMGGEGHVNSLFPRTDAVREQHSFVVAVLDSPKPPPSRITLTLHAVAKAREVWLLVGGAAKADAVAAALGGASPDEIPAAGAVGTERTIWYLDDAAAANLRS